jgi:hypothetical protein
VRVDRLRADDEELTLAGRTAAALSAAFNSCFFTFGAKAGWGWERGPVNGLDWRKTPRHGSITD